MAATKEKSTAIGIFYEQVHRCHDLPLEAKLDEPNETTSAAMAAAEMDVDIYGPFDNVNDMMKVLKT